MFENRKVSGYILNLYLTQMFLGDSSRIIPEMETGLKVEIAWIWVPDLLCDLGQVISSEPWFFTSE